MLPRRILLYVLFAVIGGLVAIITALAFFITGFNHPIAVGIVVVGLPVSVISLVLWAVVFLKEEPELSRIALVVHLVLLIVLGVSTILAAG